MLCFFLLFLSRKYLISVAGKLRKHVGITVNLQENLILHNGRRGGAAVSADSTREADTGIRRLLGGGIVQGKGRG